MFNFMGFTAYSIITAAVIVSQIFVAENIEYSHFFFFFFFTTFFKEKINTTNKKISIPHRWVSHFPYRIPSPSMMQNTELVVWIILFFDMIYPQYCCTSQYRIYSYVLG